MKLKSFVFQGIVSLIAIACGFTSCTNSDDTKITLNVDPTTINFEADLNQDRVITIETNSDQGWDYNVEGTWISHSKSGNTIIVGVSDNDGEDREGNITISAGNVSKIVTITQKGSGGIINVNFGEVTGVYNGVSSNGYTGEFEIIFKDDEREFHLVAFDDLHPIPERFTPSPATYTPNTNSELLTYLIGNSNDITGLSGSRYINGETNVIITDGDITLTVSESGIYTIKATLTGEDINTNFPYEFKIDFNDQIIFDSDVALDYYNLGGETNAYYYGDTNNSGISRFDARFMSVTEPDGYTFHGFRAMHIFSDIVEDVELMYIPSGTYKIRKDKDKFTIRPGFVNDEDGSLGGAYFYKSVSTATNPDYVLAEYGSVIIENNGISYTIYGHIAGKDLRTETIQNRAFRKVGAFNVTNMVIAEHYDLTPNNIISTFYGFATIKVGSNGTPPTIWDKASQFVINMTSNSKDTSGSILTLELYVDETNDYTFLPTGAYPINDTRNPNTLYHGNYENAGIKGSRLSLYAVGGIEIIGVILITEGSLDVDFNSVTGKYIITGEFIGKLDQSDKTVSIDVTVTDRTVTFRDNS